MFLLVVSDIKKGPACEGWFLFYFQAALNMRIRPFVFFVLFIIPCPMIPKTGDTLLFIGLFSNYL